MIKDYLKHPERKKKDGISVPRINSFIEEVVMCYHENVKKCYDKGIEEVFDENFKNFDPSFREINRNVQNLQEMYKLTIGRDYKNPIINNFYGEIENLVYIMRANERAVELEDMVKKEPEKAILHYEAKLDELNQRIKTNNRLVAQTRFILMADILAGYLETMKKEDGNRQEVMNKYLAKRSDFDDYTLENLEFLTYKHLQKHEELMGVRAILG
jgi:hypothetical protein